ncbi:hypothetical protein QNO07_02240 [Streptomyces sp. 549]|uniref:hypothetical protein n=1 Tax=Streptomyces sp. 549 TaxID=3049076 RepID=UPI0024C3AA21|nr:hypothetical protein [Streptomyces sp. 549]MDK1472256.1 hypothetical protein [Streptomyces sp. 549]
MSNGSQPAGYRCEVRADGLVYGTGETVPYVLGTFQSISTILALRWLRTAALRIADRLDPDPQHSTWVRLFMRLPTVPFPDCPTRLRTWAADRDGQREARQHLKAGHPLFRTFADTDCTYALSVSPSLLPADEPDRASPEPIPHRIGGLPRPPQEAHRPRNHHRS